MAFRLEGTSLENCASVGVSTKVLAAWVSASPFSTSPSETW